MSLVDHWEKLRYVVEISKYRSLSRAATSLRLSQPGLSVALKTLEIELGRKLFVRQPTGVIPTHEGELLIEFANRLLHESEIVEGTIRSGGVSIAGHIRIATHESISIYFLPRFLRHFRETLPNLTVSLVTGRSRMAVERLKASEVDVAVSVDPPSDRFIITAPLFADCFNLYIARHLKDSLDFSSLPLVLMADAFEATGADLEHRLGEVLKKFPEHIDCENHETVRALTKEGLGIGLLPFFVAERDLAAGGLSALEDPRLIPDFSPHWIALSYLRSRESEPAIARVAMELIKYSKEWQDRGRIRNR